tara:strand:- start:487 stop:984 length:498 start_codon:yes stop_codon:yes gene_type:complete
MKVVLAKLTDVFILKDYFSMDTEVERETALIKFYIDLSSVGLKDKTIGSLIALIAAGHAKIYFIDGYHENVFYRCQMLFANMLRTILGEGLTKSLLAGSIIYRKVDSYLDLENEFIELANETKLNEDEVININETTWKDYVAETYPKLYEDKYRVFAEDYDEVLN